MSPARLEDVMANFDWATYTKKLGAPAFTEITSHTRTFFKGVDPSFQRSRSMMENLSALASCSRRGRRLSTSFVNENSILRQDAERDEKIQPRWRRCVVATDGQAWRSAG